MMATWRTRSSANSLSLRRTSFGSPILRACRNLHTKMLHHHLQVFPRFRLLAGIAQQIRGMVRDSEFRVPEIVDLAAQVGHGVIESQQVLGSDRAESHDDLGLH